MKDKSQTDNWSAVYGLKRIDRESAFSPIAVTYYELTRWERIAVKVRKAMGWSILGGMFIASLWIAPIIFAIAVGVAIAFLAIDLIEG